MVPIRGDCNASSLYGNYIAIGYRYCSNNCGCCIRGVARYSIVSGTILYSSAYVGRIYVYGNSICCGGYIDTGSFGNGNGWSRLRVNRGNSSSSTPPILTQFVPL